MNRFGRSNLAPTMEETEIDRPSLDQRSWAPLTTLGPARRVVLKVDGLEKRYGAQTAVDGLSFEVREGEVFGLLGPNGAGKTTTISIVATERCPSRGSATVFGHSVCDEPDTVRRIIGIVPQDIAIYPMLTAAENLAFFGRLYNVKRAELEERVDELLRFVGLEGRRDDYVATFSGGMKRRLNLAVALVHRPRLILLDEPTVGVDPQSREHIFEMVRRLRDAGNAILYTTHYMEEAEELCDRLGIMSQGKLIASGTLEELLGNLECAETVELHGLPEATDLSALLASGGVCDIQSSHGVVRLFVHSAAQLLGPLHKVINGSNSPVRVKITPVSLEQLFLHMTGKELGD